MLKAMYQAINIVCAFVLLSIAIISNPHSVIAQIVPGVQQSAAQTANVTGTVIRSDGTPITGADIQLIGPAILTTKSDAHGTFSFISVPYGTYRIIANTATLGTASRDNVVVKGDISLAIQYTTPGGENLKTIARVSTRNAGISINVTPASIASVNPSDYAFEGNASWQRLLERIPGVAVSGNLNGGQTTAVVIPDGPFQPTVLSINGALPYETSVTLDGMPLNNVSYGGTSGSGYDLYALPLAAFETADVVRGPGANAPSIVDSIGGSFVLHAPGEVEKNHLEFSASNDAYGGIVSNVGLAFRIGKLSANIVYGVNDSPGPLGNYNFIPANTQSPSTVNGQTFLGCGSPPSPFGCSSEIPYEASNYQGNNVQFQNPLFLCCSQDSTAWSRYNDALALSYRITPNVTAQAFYAGSSAAADSSDWIAQADFVPDPGYTGSLTPGQHQFICCSLGLNSRESSSLLEEKLTAFWGRGVLRLAALQNNSFLHLTDVSLLPNGLYQVWGTGYYAAAPTTPVNFNGAQESLTFPSTSLDFREWVNSRDFLGSYATQLGSNSTIGISYVTSYYNTPLEETFDFEAFGFAGSNSTPTSVSQTTNETRLYATENLSNALSIDASWYFSKATYHVQNPAATGDFVNSVFQYNAPRLGVTWKPQRDVVVRASAGGGYALPPLSDLVSTNTPPFCTTICTQSIDNLNLRPEEAFGFDLGTDIRFRHDTVLSFDLYRTNLYGQIFQSTSLTGTFTGLPLYTTQYNNLAQSRYEGINFDIRHDVSRGTYWQASLGLTRSYVVNVPPGFYDQPGALNSVNTYIIPGINFDGCGLAAVPYANGSAQIGYRWAPGKYIDLTPAYYGKGNPYFEPAFLEFDMHAGYALTKSFSLLVTFRNVTGIYGQNYQSLLPSIGAPTVAGEPFALIGIPYGPRAVIVTGNFAIR